MCIEGKFKNWDCFCVKIKKPHNQNYVVEIKAST